MTLLSPTPNFTKFFRIKFSIVFVTLFFFCFACQDIERGDPIDLLTQGYLGFATDGQGTIGVVSSDYSQTGRFALLSLDGLPLPGYVSIHSDAVVRYDDGLLYVLNRLNRDNIQVLQRNLYFQTVREIAFESGSNPQDLALFGDRKAYVTLYNRSELYAFDPAVGIATAVLDLGTYAEETPLPDGLPELGGLLVEGNFLYVSVQRLDRNAASGNYPPSGASFLIEINALTDTVSGVYTFQSQNPFGELKRFFLEGDAHLIAVCPNRLGFDSELDGGVEAFNLRTRVFRPGFLYSEETAGGDILEAELLSETTGYALVLDAAFNSSIQRFNPLTGEKTGEVLFQVSGAGLLSDMLLAPNGYLYVADGDFSDPGVRIFDTNNGDRALTAAPIPVGLRPSSLIYLPASD